MNFSESKQISLDEIDGQDYRFRVGLTGCNDSLLDSLREAGQLYPVLVKKESDRYIVIDGFKRISAVRKLGITSVLIKRCDEKPISDLRLLLYHVHSIRAQRPLYELEKADMFAAMMNRFSVRLREISEKYAPLADQAIFPGIEETCTWISGLPDIFRSYIQDKNIRLHILSILRGSGEDSAHRLLEIGRRLQLGANKLRQLFVLTIEISKRDSALPSLVLEKNGVNDIVEHAAWTDAQKWEKILAVLSRLRYPEWTGIEAEIEGAIRKMKLPDSVALAYPEFLEGDSLALTLSFRTEEELRTLSDKMAGIADSEELGKILKWIKSTGG